ncbi:hypothetical protein AMK22_01375 [Streptomyces sp. CB01580]|nr:hypothetical protein AMK22_01375 [Streptomyces sp. CB01580]
MGPSHIEGSGVRDDADALGLMHRMAKLGPQTDMLITEETCFRVLDGENEISPPERRRAGAMRPPHRPVCSVPLRVAFLISCSPRDS